MKLEAQADELACRAQHDEGKACRRKAEHHANRVPDAMLAQLSPLTAGGGLNHADRLDREDWQDARHEVQDETAEQGRPDKEEEIYARSRPGRACPRTSAIACARFTARCPLPAGRSQDVAGLCRNTHGNWLIASGRNADNTSQCFWRTVSNRRQSKCQPVRPEGGWLGSGMNDRMAVGEKARVARYTGKLAACRRKHPRVAVCCQARLAFKEGRHISQRICNPGGICAVRHLLAADIDAGRHFDRFRNADVLANEVVDRAAKPHRAIGGLRHLNRERQHDRAAIAIIHDLAIDDGDQLGKRPVNFADLILRDRGLFVPIGARRDPGITRILPVDVPVLIHLEAETEPDGLSGDRDISFRDKLDTRMTAIHWLGRCRR